MKNHFLSFLGNFNTSNQEPSSDDELLDAIRTARQEWHAAQSYFENVSDQELVDYSIYKLEAAKRKYMYLLNLARKEGLVNNQVIQEKNNLG
jgi:hypothetical protein